MVKALMSIIILTVFSCEVQNEFLITDFVSQPVLTGFLEPDSVVLMLRTTQPISASIDGSFQIVDDAQISIIHSSTHEIVTTLTADGADRYFTKTSLTPGQHYTINVESPTLGTITTDSILIPLPMQLINVDIENYSQRESIFNNGRIQNISGDIQFRKGLVTALRPPAFMIEMYGKTRETIYPLLESDDLEGSFSEACGFVSNIAIIFTDLCFTADDIDLPFFARAVTTEDFDTLQVEVYRINPEFYDYAIVESQSIDGLSALFTQPEISLSNVNGGLGFVGGRNGTTVNIPL